MLFCPIKPLQYHNYDCIGLSACSVLRFLSIGKLSVVFFFFFLGGGGGGGGVLYVSG